MSELKATTAQEIVRNEKDCDYMDELLGGVKMPPTQVYLKSEADKVIADLEESHKKEVEQLLMEIMNLKHSLELASNECCSISERGVKNARHHKYKRCLAMAERCKYRMYYLAAVVEQEASKIIPLKEQIRWYEKRERRMDYWKNRWLELAEKFKEEAK